MNRLASSSQTVHAVSFAVRNGYDLNGNRTHIVYPGGLAVSYAYDAENRLAGVSVRHAGGAESFALGYDGAGRLTSLAYPNGIAAAFGYDAESRLTSFDHGGLVAHTLFRDARGFKTGEDIVAGLAPDCTNALSQTRTHNDADQLTAAGAESYTYDENGCLTLAAGAAYGWDYDNRLVQVGDATYLYDATGVRVGRAGNGTTNYFAADYGSPLKQPLAEADALGRVTRCYVWSPLGLLAHYDLNPESGAVLAARYYHANEQGSTLALSNGRGMITDRFAYSAHGQLLGRAGVTRTPYRWLGGFAVRAEVSGLYYMRNRHYSADMRRFISADPSGLDGGPNLYAYCLGNPLAYVDPLGLGGYDQYQSTLSADTRSYSSFYSDGFWESGDSPDSRALTHVDSLLPSGAIGTSLGDSMAESMMINTFTAPAFSIVTEAVGTWVGGLFGNSVAESGTSILRVRHYGDISGIEADMAIIPSSVARGANTGLAGVHVEVAPFGNVSGASDALGSIKTTAYVEFNAPQSMIPTYGVGSRNTAMIPTQTPLSLQNLNPTFVQPKPWWKLW